MFARLKFPSPRRKRSTACRARHTPYDRSLRVENERIRVVTRRGLNTPEISSRERAAVLKWQQIGPSKLPKSAPKEQWLTECNRPRCRAQHTAEERSQKAAASRTQTAARRLRQTLEEQDQQAAGNRVLMAATKGKQKREKYGKFLENHMDLL